jgi:hypothetical protein
MALAWDSGWTGGWIKTEYFSLFFIGRKEGREAGKGKCREARSENSDATSARLRDEAKRNCDGGPLLPLFFCLLPSVDPPEASIRKQSLLLLPEVTSFFLRSIGNVDLKLPEVIALPFN